MFIAGALYRIRVRCSDCHYGEELEEDSPGIRRQAEPVSGDVLCLSPDVVLPS